MTALRASALVLLVSGLGSGCMASGIRVGDQVTTGGTGGQTTGGQGGGSNGACLTLSQVMLSFGYVPVGTSSILGVTFTNLCEGPLTITAAIDGADARLFSVLNAPMLAPLGSGTANVSYAPLAYTGQSNATVTFSASDGEAFTLNRSGWRRPPSTSASFRSGRRSSGARPPRTTPATRST